MAQIVVTNFVKTSLRAPIQPTDTVLPLAAGAGASFNIPAGDWCYLTINDSVTVEVVKYISTGLVVDDNITVQRGRDGTTPKAFPAGACVTEGWNTAQVTDYVTEIFNNLIGGALTPVNTIALTAAPVAAPPAGVIYAINVTTGSLWYFDSPTWVKIQANAVLQMTVNPVAPPPDSVVWAVNTTSHALWFWTGSAWLSVGGGSSSQCPQIFCQGDDGLTSLLVGGSYPFRSMPGVTFVNDVMYVPPGATAAMHIDGSGYFHFDRTCTAQFFAEFSGFADVGLQFEGTLAWTHSVVPGDGFGITINKLVNSTRGVYGSLATLPFAVGAGDLWDCNLIVNSGGGVGNLTLGTIYRGVTILAVL